MTSEDSFNEQVQSVREVRENLEASILPVATSVDGCRFSFQASLYGLALRIGGCVVLEGDGSPRLGQVLTLGLARRLAGELALALEAVSGPAAQTQVEIRPG